MCRVIGIPQWLARKQGCCRSPGQRSPDAGCRVEIHLFAMTKASPPSRGRGQSECKVLDGTGRLKHCHLPLGHPAQVHSNSDGRSPDLRVNAVPILPRQMPSGRSRVARRLQLRGQSRNWLWGRTVFPFIPTRRTRSGTIAGDRTRNTLIRQEHVLERCCYRTRRFRRAIELRGNLWHKKRGFGAAGPNGDPQAKRPARRT